MKKILGILLFFGAYSSCENLQTSEILACVIPAVSAITSSDGRDVIRDQSLLLPEIDYQEEFDLDSLRAAGSPNVLLLTLPKTGTNLALKLLKLALNEATAPHLGAMTKSLYWGHDWKVESQSIASLNPSPEKIKILQDSRTKLVLLLRDPRQHVLALLRSIRKPLTRKNIEWGILNFPMMMKMQTGQNSFLKYKDINECYEHYLQWLMYSDVYLTTFEKLVGPKGGGNAQVQLQEVENIIGFLGKRITRQEAQALADGLFGGTPTFKEGKIDSWKKYYSAENKALFKRVAGDLLIKLGYEKDNNW